MNTAGFILQYKMFIQYVATFAQCESRVNNLATYAEIGF